MSLSVTLSCSEPCFFIPTFLLFPLLFCFLIFSLLFPFFFGERISPSHPCFYFSGLFSKSYHPHALIGSGFLSMLDSGMAFLEGVISGKRSRDGWSNRKEWSHVKLCGLGSVQEHWLQFLDHSSSKTQVCVSQACAVFHLEQNGGVYMVSHRSQSWQSDPVPRTTLSNCRETPPWLQAGGSS